jgi:hypothetical protein
MYRRLATESALIADVNWKQDLLIPALLVRIVGGGLTCPDKHVIHVIRVVIYYHLVTIDTTIFVMYAPLRTTDMIVYSPHFTHNPIVGRTDRARYWSICVIPSGNGYQ